MRTPRVQDLLRIGERSRRVTISEIAMRPPGFKNPLHFAQHLPLIWREVDHTVRDDHIHLAIFDRDLFNITMPERNIVNAHALGGGARSNQHFGRHIHADHITGRANLFGCRKQSNPPPEPRSNTVSPGCKLPDPVGSPQPNDIPAASAGALLICPAHRWRDHSRMNRCSSSISLRWQHSMCELLHESYRNCPAWYPPLLLYRQTSIRILKKISRYRKNLYDDRCASVCGAKPNQTATAHSQLLLVECIKSLLPFIAHVNQPGLA
jgi:hypothetical protein